MALGTPTHFKISVRELVEQTERSGDINFRFSARSSALAGIRGHQRVQKSRGDDYVAEKRVADLVTSHDLCLEVSGRVDGYFPTQLPMLVEEIKTLRADPRLIPESLQRLHWGQVKVYAYLLGRDHELKLSDPVVVRLCYLQLDDDAESLLTQTLTMRELGDYYQLLVTRQITFLARLAGWQARRDKSIEQLAFPYSEYREGQRDMAVSVYRAMQSSGQLVLQAPTGIGKTMGVLYPAIKGLPTGKLEKLFFLSAKTSGQALAAGAVADMRQQGLQLRDITLTAKNKICFTPGAPCDAEHCQYAVGYYDKLGKVMDEVLLEDQALTREVIEAKARVHQMCPFELELDLSLTADVVICDYNYVFDPAVYLRRYFDGPNQHYGLLIDEAHNLVDRGREMFSAEIKKNAYLDLRRQLPVELPLMARSLAAVNAQFLALLKIDKPGFAQAGYRVIPELPQRLVQAVRKFTLAAEDWLQQNQVADFSEELLPLYFDSLRFLRIAETFDQHYNCLMIERPQGVAMKLFNVNPGPGLAEGFRRVNAAVAFSATLMPQTYFQALMGIEADASWYQIESPFDSKNLGVFATSYISTTYRDRGNSLYALADTIAAVVAQRAGNYMVFFPSFAYLKEVRDKFVERYPNSVCVSQTPAMDETARMEFLHRFEVQGDSTLVGFAVMGGIFGEGIDLKGRKLIGVIIAGVGLPQLGIERDVIRDYFEQSGQAGQGFEFAYQYPGMNRVLQTAGRVIRTETDRGIICLVDNRFNESRYRRLMPNQWQVKLSRNREILANAVAEFWAADDEASIP